MAQKRKTTSGTNQKPKMQAIPAKVDHFLAHPKPVYPEDKDRRKVLRKNLARMGCGLLVELP
jgi:hypothetical protein